MSTFTVSVGGMIDEANSIKKNIYVNNKKTAVKRRTAIIEKSHKTAVE
ncbi:hypothetical protein SAMN04487934_103213 [Eubacterium ruminantium]|nr:hypothetical protein SAMN04487934_103213 [Eubacterium ruminantium]